MLPHPGHPAREKAEIPVWHDDQQGTACVTLAGLLNALKVVGKRIEDVKIAFIGSGAANVACMRLIFAGRRQTRARHLWSTARAFCTRARGHRPPQG